MIDTRLLYQTWQIIFWSSLKEIVCKCISFLLYLEVDFLRSSVFSVTGNVIFSRQISMTLNGVICVGWINFCPVFCLWIWSRPYLCSERLFRSVGPKHICIFDPVQLSLHRSKESLVFKASPNWFVMLEPRLVKAGRWAASDTQVVVFNVLRLDPDQGSLLGLQRPPGGLPCAQLGLHGHLGRIGEIHVVYWPRTRKSIIWSSCPIIFWTILYK